MPSLHELQTAFMHGLFDAPEVPPFGIVGRGIEPLERLGIYANTARVNFVDSLRTSFPAVLRLVGDAYFRRCALAFRRDQPPASGDLQQAGVGFAGFIAGLHADDDYRYLGDVARFEWFWQEALIAAACAPFRTEKLVGRDPATFDGLRFVLHPSVRLFSSEFPCLRIWEANIDDTAEPPPIDLREGSDRLMIVRVSSGMRVHKLGIGEFNFLDAIRVAVPFGTAVERGQDTDVDFDATTALRRAVVAGAIVDCL